MPELHRGRIKDKDKPDKDKMIKAPIKRKDRYGMGPTVRNEKGR